MNKTLDELYVEALQVQNACNLSGVAHRFASVCVELSAYTNGTTERNTHEILTLWLCKMMDLNEYEDTKVTTAFCKAFDFEKKRECV